MKVKRVLSTSFVTFLVAFISLGIWIKLNAVNSFRITTDRYSPRVIAGDFVLVPLQSFLQSLPFESRPISVDDLVVVREGPTNTIARVSGREGGKIWVEAQAGPVLVSETELMGRLWAIWFSVDRVGKTGSKIRWQRVLRGIK